MTPEQALEKLSEILREGDPLLAEHVRSSDAEPVFGLLAAAGPRASGAEADYAFVVEAVHEGYLLHYGRTRLLEDADDDLALLAGDHLYALGLECLAGLGDLEAVRELADLISLCAQLHAPEADDRAREPLAGALWLAAASVVAGGARPSYAEAKLGLRDGRDPAQATRALAACAREAAAAGGFEAALERAADSIDFELPNPPAGG